MTNDNPQKATQIAINFGPVNGNVIEQHIHPVQPKGESRGQVHNPADARDHATCTPDSPAPEPKKLTISQAVILFSSLLGEPLEQGFGKHKTQLADLISAVTGYSAGSIRQKIMEIAKMDVYPHNIQQDAAIAEKIIKPYNSQVASDIRITYLDE